MIALIVKQVVLVVIVGVFLGPLQLNASEQHKPLAGGNALNATKLETVTSNNKNSTTALESKPPATVHKVNSRLARSTLAASESSLSSRTRINSFGDTIGLETALESHKDLTPAAGEHGKKYILVKKKPKHKKIKMEVYKPKMKYKKIKMKVPVKKLKKKKVKGYLVKKHKHY